MTNQEKKKLAFHLQQVFDSIQDGEYSDALNDLKRISSELGHPIHDEYLDSGRTRND